QLLSRHSSPCCSFAGHCGSTGTVKDCYRTANGSERISHSSCVSDPVATAPRSVTSHSPAADQINQCDKQSRADDRPDHGKMRSSRWNHQQLRKMERACQPGTQQCADKSQCDGNQAAAVRVAADGLAQSAADTGN